MSAEKLRNRTKEIMRKAKTIFIIGGGAKRSIFKYPENQSGFKREVAVAAITVALIAMPEVGRAAPLPLFPDAFVKAFQLKNIEASGGDLINTSRLLVSSSVRSDVVDLKGKSMPFEAARAGGLKVMGEEVNATKSPAALGWVFSKGRFNPVMMINMEDRAATFAASVKKVMAARPGFYGGEDVKVVYQSVLDHELMHAYEREQLERSCVQENEIQKLSCVMERGIDDEGERSSDLRVLEESKADVYAVLLAKQRGNTKVTEFIMDLRMQSVEDIDHQTVLSLAYSKTIPQEQLKGLTKIELAKLAEYIAMGTNTKEGMEKIQEYNTGIKALLNREGTVLADHTGLDVFAKKVEGILQAALNGEEQRMKEMKQRSKEVVFGDEGITEGKRKTFMNKKRKIPSLSQVTVLQHETKGSVFAQPQRNRFG